jgi:hypothetical protein
MMIIKDMIMMLKTLILSYTSDNYVYRDGGYAYFILCHIVSIITIIVIITIIIIIIAIIITIIIIVGYVKSITNLSKLIEL